MAPSSDLILVDGHVHFHRGFEAGPFLDSAHENFRDVARRMASDASFVGVLLLTEGPGENGFERLVAQVNQQNETKEGVTSPWSTQDTEEHISVRFTAEAHAPILVVAGRQIPTRDRLEVLAIGTRREFEEGKRIRALIQDVTRAGALPVIPWGAGKWMGRRGRLVDELITDPDLPPFFLGDSGNRPQFWPRPGQLRRAEEEGIGILSGSDPLPFSGEARRVGGFGSALSGAGDSLEIDAAASSLKRSLMAPSTSLHPFGRLESPLRFARNQLKMQFRKLVR